MKEYVRVYGNDTTKPIEKSDELLRKAVDKNDGAAYMELRKRDDAKRSRSRQINKEELMIVQEEFDRMLATTIRKESESHEDVANRVWLMKSSNGETLIERYQNAYRGVQL